MTLNGTELIHQNATTSLIRNGSFSQGLAHWFGSYCNQEAVAQEFTSIDPADQTPRHVANITTVDSEFYMDGVTPGLSQCIDRPDIVSFPSVVQVSGLELKILNSVNAVLIIRPTLTAVDGVLLVDLPTPSFPALDEEYFQHPFLFRSSTATVPVEVGSAMQLSDARNLDNSDLYRVVKTWLSFTQFGGTVPSAGQENRYTYHAIEIVAPELVFEPFASSEAGQVVFTLSDWRIDDPVQSGFQSGVLTLTITGDTGALMSSDRNQIGYPGGTGLRIGDTMTIGSYSFEIGDFPLGNWVAGQPLQMILVSPYNYGSVLRQFPPSADIDTTVWAVYAPSVVSARISKNVFKYEFTSFQTYDLLGAIPETTLKFLELRSDPAKDYLTTKGFGFDGRTIPRKDARTEIIKLDDGTSNPSGAWRRKAEYFSYESADAIKGRLQLSIQPGGFAPDALGSASVTDLGYQVPGTYSNVVFPNGRWTIGVNRFFNPVPKVGYVFQVIAAISTLEDAWKNALAAGPFSLVSFNQNTATNCTLVLHWPLTVPAPTGIATVQVQPPNAAQMFGIAPFKRSRVTDVYLTKGSQAQKFQIVDDIIFPIQYPLSSNVLLDSLQHKTDELDNILPKGSVVLYTGGGVCPAGFKRIDGFRNSSIAGVPDNHLIPVPDPAVGESISYDATTNRTTLTWKRDFPAIDDTGSVIPIPETAVTTQLTISDVFTSTQITENVTPTATQQVMQPGMRFRCPTFITPATVLTGNPLFISSIPGRALKLTPVPTNQANSGVAHVPAYSAIKIGPTFPNNKNIFMEMWVRLLALPTSGFAVLAQQRVGGGWEVSVGFDGNIKITATQGNATSVFTTTTQPLVGQAGAGAKFLHIGIYLEPPDPQTGIEDGSNITIRRSDSTSYLFNKKFFLPIGTVTSLATSSDIFVGRGAPSILGQGLSCEVDCFRIFQTNVFSQDMDFLFQNGLGISDLSQFPAAINALLAEYLFDEVSGTALINSAPAGTPHPGIAEGSISRVSGLLTIAGAGAFPTESFGMIRRDVDPSFLITNIDYTFSIASSTFDPAKPASPSGSKYGSGAIGLKVGGTGAPIQITYPFFIQSGATAQGPAPFVLISTASLTIPSPGPLLDSHQTARFGTTVVGGTNSNWAAQTLSVTVAGGKTTQFEVGYNTGNDIGTTGDNDFESNLTLGDVYYVVVATIVSTTAFFGRVSYVNKNNNRVKFVPYGQSSLPVSTLGTTQVVTIRPAILFGQGTQGFDSISKSATFTGITPTKTTSGGTVYWSYRSFVYDSAVSVLGRLIPPANTRTLKLEPSGYLMYDAPADTERFGNSGHSHLVDRGDVVTKSNYVPRVNETNVTFRALPFVDVAGNHTHGFLPRYRYSMPEFRAFTLCEKL